MSESVCKELSTAMKGLVVAVFCVVFLAVVSAVPAGEKYTDQYDNVDVDEILNTKRLRTNYYHCLKTGKKCTKEGQTLRDILPDALQTKCSKCTNVQKQQSKKVIRFTVKNHPTEFLELEKIFDPERKYRKDFASELEKEGFVLPK